MAAERPQLLVTNLMVASAMLSCLWQISERGSVPYSEVYLDAIQNAARSRSWFRVRPARSRGVWIFRCTTRPRRRPLASLGRTI